MEINKQLFEDVLSGKLKGTFVRRDGTKLNSSSLRPIGKRLFAIGTDIYQDNGVICTNSYNSNLDIINFIPDTNIKENELTIEIPEGKIVDWDESKKQNKIVLKDKQLTYADVCNAFYKNKIVYYTDARGNISSMPFSELDEDNPYDSNNASTEHQLECILAKNKLATVAKYLNDGWKPNKGDSVWIIGYDCWSGYFAISTQAESIIYNCHGLVVFKSEDLAHQAFKILGEETIKLALEPLGI